MKGWCTAVVLSMFVGMMVPLPSSATTTWYYVQGTVFNSDTTVEPYATLELINERTSDYLYTEADGFGEYLFDCADFDNSWEYGDTVELIASSADGQVSSYSIRLLLMADYDTINMSPMLHPPPMPTLKDVYICKMDEYHRMESCNTWTWNFVPPYDYSGQNFIGVRVIMDYMVHDLGDDAGWPDIPPELIPPPDYKIHVNISFELSINPYDRPGLPQETYGFINYSLSKGECYYWDPSLSLVVKETWNGERVQVTGWIRIEWTDWYGRLYLGDWNADGKITTFSW